MAACAVLAAFSVRAAGRGIELAVVGQIGGATRAVVADGTTVWVGEGIGVTRLDVSNPDVARWLGHRVVADGADVWSLAHHGGRLFVGDSAGLHVLDVRDPSAPRSLGGLATGGAVRALTAVGFADGGSTWLFVVQPDRDILWVVVGSDGVVRPLATLAGTAGVTAPVAVDGIWAVAPGDDARILELHDPAMPVEVGRIETPGRVRGVAARDGVAYLSDTSAGLIVVTLGRTVREVTRLTGIGSGRLYLSGRYLYLLEQNAVGPNTVRLIDVSDPLAPRDALSGESTYAVLRGALDLVGLGEQLVVARGTEVNVVDVASVYYPRVRAEYSPVWPLVQVADAGDCVYVAKGAAGLDVVDVSYAPGAEVGLSWRPPGGTFGVHIGGGYAYLSTSDGMARFDVQAPCDPIPREVPFAPAWGATQAIATGGDRLVATTAQALMLATLHGDDPPRELATIPYERLAGWPAGATAHDVAVYEGGVAYVAAGTAGLVVLNLLNSATPRVFAVDRAPEGLGVLSLSLVGERLAVGTSGGLLLYELVDPFEPNFRGAMLGSEALLDVALAGDRLYAAADLAGVLVYDVSDLDRPTLSGNFQPPYAITSVDAAADTVVAAGAGLLVLEPRAAGTRPSPSPTAGTPVAVVPTATPSPSPPATHTVVPTVSATPSFTLPPRYLPLSWP